MFMQRESFYGIARWALLVAALSLGWTRAHSQAPKAAPVADEQAVAQTQEELFRLLRVSPTLTAVVERDPSLLANQEYVNRTNPELGRFIETHPEIARNPDFYLFSGLQAQGGRRNQALERKIWPESSAASANDEAAQTVLNDLIPFLIFLCILGSLIWLIHMFAANRRWQRMFKMQMEAHGKLIDRFGSSQELIHYMETEAGKRFLEAAPIPDSFGGDGPVPNVIARVLTPLQIGVVLSLLGIGLLILRYSIESLRGALLLGGVVTLMPGIGFILSAGLTWVLAGRLDLLPKTAQQGDAASGDTAGRL